MMKFNKKINRKKLVLWMLGVVTGLILLMATLGYLYYNQLIKKTLTEMVVHGSHGRYTINIKTLYYGVFSGNLFIRDLLLIPDTTRDSAVLVFLRIEELVIHDIELKKALFDKEIMIGKALIKSPELRLVQKHAMKPDTAVRINDSMPSIPLPRGVKFIQIEQILLKGGSFLFADETRDTIRQFSVPSFDVGVEKFRVDSNWNTDPKIFNADDIHGTFRGMEQQTGNQMYRVSLGEIGFSTAGSEVVVRGFHLEPLFNEHDFTRKLGYQTDRMDIRAGTIKLSHINWPEVIMNQRIIAGKLVIDSLILYDYRDKRIPMKPGFRPPMPQQLLRNMTSYYIWIDSVEVLRGKATYAEQVGPEPGIILFDQIEAQLTGLTNDSVWLTEKRSSRLSVTTMIQGTGHLQATMDFAFGDPQNRFSLAGTLGKFNLPDVNPMLSRLLPAEITSGRLQKLIIPEIRFNDNVARGKLTMYYTDLTFKLFDQKATTWSGIKTGVINWVAGSILIHSSNPDPSGKVRTGIVYFQRDKHKSILNFIWKSVLSGCQSNLGFNDRHQKEIKKGKQN